MNLDTLRWGRNNSWFWVVEDGSAYVTPCEHQKVAQMAPVWLGHSSLTVCCCCPVTSPGKSCCVEDGFRAASSSDTTSCFVKWHYFETAVNIAYCFNKLCIHGCIHLTFVEICYWLNEIKKVPYFCKSIEMALKKQNIYGMKSSVNTNETYVYANINICNCFAL